MYIETIFLLFILLSVFARHLSFKPWEYHCVDLIRFISHFWEYLHVLTTSCNRMTLFSQVDTHIYIYIHNIYIHIYNIYIYTEYIHNIYIYTNISVHCPYVPIVRCGSPRRFYRCLRLRVLPGQRSPRRTGDEPRATLSSTLDDIALAVVGGSWAIREINWLVVWNMAFIFPYIGNVIIPTDCHLFQRGRYTTNQIIVYDIIHGSGDVD